jgi:2-phospho-L-lactate guanylyltransferase
MILIPVKNLQNAKQRLASVLDQPSRTELAKAMLTDVLGAIASWPSRPAVSLVTNDPFAVDLARSLKFEIIPDDAAKSETEAIEKATDLCRRNGAAFTLVLPADIPLITVVELDQVIEAAPEKGSVLVPSADQRGTNAALRTPCDLFPLRFGNDSFVPHRASAEATGKPCVVLSLPGIALDIDTPSDLQQLCDSRGETKSQKLARQWNLKSLSLVSG